MRRSCSQHRAKSHRGPGIGLNVLTGLTPGFWALLSLGRCGRKRLVERSIYLEHCSNCHGWNWKDSELEAAKARWPDAGAAP
jgi:hypothetical protein